MCRLATRQRRKRNRSEPRPGLHSAGQWDRFSSDASFFPLLYLHVCICSRAGGAVSGRLNARFPALPVETVRQADRQTVSCLVGHSDYCEAYKQQLSGYLLYLPIVHQVCTVRIDCSRGMYPCRCNQWMQKYKSGVESQS